MRVLMALTLTLFLAPSCTSSGGHQALDGVEARGFAEEFARAWIEVGWAGVRHHVAAEGPGQDDIQREHEFFVAQEFRVAGRARYVDQVSFTDSPGFSIPLIGRRGDLSNPVDPTLREWTMELVLVEEDGSWRVAQYSYESGAPLE
jgi:hypothetical protein